MFGVKPLAVVAALACCGAVDGLAARQLPIASQDESDALLERVDMRRCYWAESHLICTPAFETNADAGETSDGYYAPGIYVGEQNPYAAPSR
jgi:hypothetical protein